MTTLASGVGLRPPVASSAVPAPLSSLLESAQPTSGRRFSAYTSTGFALLLSSLLLVLGCSVAQAATPPPIPPSACSVLGRSTAGTWQCLVGPARTSLTADQYYYFNCATGSDSNSGTAAAPFADPVKAYQVAQRTLDLGGQWHVYAVNQGSCTGANWVFEGPPPPGNLGWQSFVIQDGSISGHIYASNGAQFGLANVTVTPTPGLNFVDAASPINVALNYVTANAAAGSEILHVVGSGGVGAVGGTFTLNGGGRLIGVFNAEDAGMVAVSAAVAFSGTPAWSSFASQADLNGVVDWTGSTCSGTYRGPGSRGTSGGQVITASGCP